SQTPGTSTTSGTSTTQQTSGTQQQSNPDQALQTIKASIVSTFDQLIQNKKESDENFRTKYANANAEILIENLVAWMNPKVTEDGNHHNK
ncbi:hypothetical protein, partial [Pseudomonas sp. GW460-13]|uniref:hypothetical protein n=1 Tax=Pseudomonas sp. GW460-13 TaxID=2070590 RepID=UPI001C43B495